MAETSNRARIEELWLRQPHLGRRLRAARLERQLTQQALGRELSPPMTRAAVANMEAGQQRVLVHTLLQLAAALQLEPAELLPPLTRGASAVEDRELLSEVVQKLGVDSQRAALLVTRFPEVKSDEKADEGATGGRSTHQRPADDAHAHRRRGHRTPPRTTSTS